MRASQLQVLAMLPLNFTVLLACICDSYTLIYLRCICVAISTATDVRAIAVTSRSVEVTWKVSSTSGIIGYLISYHTTASYASSGSVTVNGGSTTSHTLTNLEEDTLYTITVQATSSDNRMSANSNEVSVRTYTDGK